MTSLDNTKLFAEWLKKHNNNNNIEKDNFQSWISKQVAIAKPNLSPVNWGDYKQEAMKPSDYVDFGTSNQGFTLPPLSRDRLGGRNFKLVPQRTMVRRVGKMPYFATRWKKVPVDDRDRGFIIIPMDDYEGDMEVLFETWKNYIESKDNSGDEKFIVPLVALQEMIYKEFDGILMQRDKRIVGVASLDIDENDEASISILSAAPLEIEEGIEEEVEDALISGIRQYIKHKGYSSDEELFGEEEEDDEEEEGDNDKEEEVAIDTDKIDEDDEDEEVKIEKASKSQPETIFRMMVVRGLYPKTGKPENPGAWIRRRTFEKNMEEQGLDASNMTQQMDNFREQNRNQNFFQFQNLFYEERYNTLQRVHSMKRDKSGHFIGKDDKAMNNVELMEELKNSAIQEVMYMSRPSIDLLNIPETGPVIDIPQPSGGKRKAKARLAENYVPIEKLLGKNPNEMSNEALRDWFSNEYLKGRGRYRGQNIKSHWTDIQLAEDPSNQEVDVLVRATDPSLKRNQSQRIYSSEYDMQQSESKFSRIKTMLGWTDIIEGKFYKDLWRTSAEGTQRVSEEEDVDRINSVALALLLQNEFMLRSGNHANIERGKNPGIEHKGVIQFTKDNVKFGEDGNAYISFVGKAGVQYNNLKLNKPELVDALRKRWETADERDGMIFNHDASYDGVYMDSITNGWFTPHDLRTVHANRVAMEYIDKIRREDDMPKTPIEFQKRAMEVSNFVAGMLNDTVKNALGYYMASSVLLELGSEVDDSDGLLTAYSLLGDGSVLPPTQNDIQWIANKKQQTKQKRGRSRR